MHNEMNEEHIIETSPGDDDIMLPEGYGADDALFPDETADDLAGQPEVGEDDGAEDPAPATEQDPDPDVDGKGNAEAPATEPPAPATEQVTEQPKPNMLKFKATHDRVERDVELSESDLPGIWQKAQNHDRMRSRLEEQQKLLTEVEQLAKSMGYSSAKEMTEKATGAYLDAEVKSMTAAGVPERVAKAVVAQEIAQRGAQNAEAPQSAPAPQRDPKAEVAELLQAHPELYGKPLPQEVVAAAGAGKNLLSAYTEYEARQAAQEADRIRRENDILKQNAANAAKAPVKGVTPGGAPKTEKGEDDFLRGFNEDY